MDQVVESVVVGLDPGFGSIKVAKPTGESAVVQSYFGVGQLVASALAPTVRRPGTKARHNDEVPHQVQVGNVTYLVDGQVERYTKPQERVDVSRFRGGPDMEAQTMLALHELLGAGSHQVRLMVGLPVEVLAKRKEALETVRGLQRWLHGHHEVVIDGQDFAVDVLGALVQAQPLGTFFSWSLDGQGRWRRTRDDAKAPIGIIDVGFNTLDLYIVENGGYVPLGTRGANLGIMHMVEQFNQELQNRFGVHPMSLHEGDRFLRDPRRRLYMPGGRVVDVEPIVRQIIETSGMAIQRFVQETWSGVQLLHMLGTGGGALLVEDILKQTFPNVEILPQPDTANAIGLARSALLVRRWPRVTI